MSDATLGVLSVARLKLTLPPLHIVDAEVNVLLMVGVGSTVTSIGARATPAQLDVPDNFGVKTKRTTAGMLPLFVRVPFNVATPAVND